MEMHQIRYFLAVSQTLNFTRAAEECHVAQPSLTRAIKTLEEELGAELFRRERQFTHLTDFGRRMLPLLRQSHDSALAAKDIAASLRKGALAPLTIALGNTVEMSPLAAPLTELARAFAGLELKFSRGSSAEITELLKRGDAELAVTGAMNETWDRLDSWLLFTESFSLVVAADPEFAGRDEIDVSGLAGQSLLKRPYCEMSPRMDAILHACEGAGSGAHEVAADADVNALVQAGLGVAILPARRSDDERLRRVRIAGLDLACPVILHAVAGRPRSMAAATLIKMLRARDWSASVH